MATFIPANRTAKVALEGTQWGQDWVNTLWVQFATTITQAILDDLALVIRVWWHDNIRALVFNNVGLLQVTATDQTAANGLQGVDLAGASGTKAVATPVSSAIAPVVSFRTAKTGRSFRGRNYITGLGHDDFNSSDMNEVGSTIMGNLTSGYAALPTALSGMSTSPGTHVVASHFTASAPRGTALLTPITAYTMDNKVDMQRRRLEGRGR